MPMKCEGRAFFAVEKKLSHTVASAGQCVKVTSSTIAGSRSSQGVTRVRKLSKAVLSRAEAPDSVLVVLQDARRFALRILHRFSRRLRTGERRLQAVVAVS